ncbi:hypothetical protein GCM10027190_61680 [Spirosoma areae]
MLYGEQGLSLSRQIHYPKGEIRALSNVGRVIHDLGNLPKALQIQFSALLLAEKNELPAETAWPLNRIGSIYSSLNDVQKAYAYHRKSMSVFLASNDELGVATTQMNAGLMFIRMNRLDSALYYENLAYEKIIRLNYTSLLPLILGNLGQLQVKKGNRQLALKYLQQEVQVAFALKDHRSSSGAYTQMASLYKQENQLDSCIYYAQKGLEEANVIAYRQGILATSLLLTQAYQSKSDFNKAFAYQQLMVAAKDSLYSTGNIQAIEQMVADEEERQREIETTKIAYQNQIRQYGLLAGLGIFLLIVLVLYRNNLQKQKANTLLHQQKEEINLQRSKAEQALTELKATQAQLIQREKMASLGELTAGIAHEIQNPLNFVNNFSEVSAELVGELKDELQADHKAEALELVDDLSKNLEKITLHGRRASSIVKGMLEHSRSSTGQSEPTNLNALADEYLRLAYQGQLAKDKSFKTELNTHFDPEVGPVNIIPQEIGRVLLNLFSNAFYAVRERQKQGDSDYYPIVTVTTSKAKKSTEIRVGDNGTGMSEAVQQKIFQPFFTTKPTGEGTGLGLSLSYDIVTKGHGGMLTMKSYQGEGTEFVISLPES